MKFNTLPIFTVRGKISMLELNKSKYKRFLKTKIVCFLYIAGCHFPLSNTYTCLPSAF